jgi:four helix bundle protein
MDTGYRKLEVWQMARDLSVDIHKMTLLDLPKFEMYEMGSQIRRSAKSIRANIVEGYGRRKYKLEFLKHLTYSIGSKDETADHLETLFETGSLTDKEKFVDLQNRTELLGKKLHHFYLGVEREHNT